MWAWKYVTFKIYDLQINKPQIYYLQIYDLKIYALLHQFMGFKFSDFAAQVMALYLWPWIFDPQDYSFQNMNLMPPKYIVIFWLWNSGRLMLPGKIWPWIFDPQILANKLWPQNGVPAITLSVSCLRQTFYIFI